MTEGHRPTNIEARTFEWRWDKGQPILKHVHSNDGETKTNQYWSTYIRMTVRQRPTNIEARTFEWRWDKGQPIFWSTYIRMTVRQRPTNILKHVHSNDGETKANQYWSTYIRMTVGQRPTNIEARTFKWRWDKGQPILKHVHSNAHLKSSFSSPWTSRLRCWQLVRWDTKSLATSFMGPQKSCTSFILSILGAVTVRSLCQFSPWLQTQQTGHIILWTHIWTFYLWVEQYTNLRSQQNVYPIWVILHIILNPRIPVSTNISIVVKITKFRANEIKWLLNSCIQWSMS